MAGKIPTAEEVIALVAAGDGGMQQLIAQAQAQQAQALAEAQAQAVAQAQAQHHALVQHAVASAADAAMADVHMAVDSAALGVHGGKMDASAMEFMPLSGATVVDNAHSMGGDLASAAAPGDVESSMDGGTANGGNNISSNSLAIKRKSIPLSMKKEAIEWIMGPGKGIPSRAEKHFSALHWDVSASSFRKWWKNRDKILGDSSHKKRITGGGRKPYLENSEEKLLVIVIQERAKKDRVTRKWIAKTAQHMFQRTNANFKASENWVTKFIRRNGLTLKRSYVTYEQQQQPPLSGAAALVADEDGHLEIDDDDDGEDAGAGGVDATGIDESMGVDGVVEQASDHSRDPELHDDGAAGAAEVHEDEERKTVLV
uniref:HTH CENPB-type domain-containing protein n=1 Tax=Globisporangium ultimum (strain ATCC 200006 / CBS 805.95 / DAOM BR144) TaxID=431595 RepID=K3X0K2_GLOUD